MPRKNAARPTTPSLTMGIAHHVGPTSPPQTPITTSPLLARTKVDVNLAAKARHPSPFQDLPLPPVSQRSNIQPKGNGHQFSFTPGSVRTDQLSPRSSAEESDGESSGSGSPPRSSSSEDEDEDDEDDEDVTKEDEREKAKAALEGRRQTAPPAREGGEDESDHEMPNASVSSLRKTVLTASMKSSFTIHEMSDFEPMDSDYERFDILRPFDIESAKSDRSRSRSRNPPAELDPRVVDAMESLNCSNSSDSEEEEIDEDDAHREFMRMQRELRMRKRRSHGSSLSKRTHSERGDDSDREDLLNSMEPWSNNDGDMAGVHFLGQPGEAMRRTRRKTGERWSKFSIEFLGFVPPPIHEVEETNTDEEIVTDGTRLFKELPYYMEVDSD